MLQTSDQCSKATLLFGTDGFVQTFFFANMLFGWVRTYFVQRDAHVWGVQGLGLCLSFGLTRLVLVGSGFVPSASDDIKI